MIYQDFLSEYEKKSDEELLRLQLDLKDLTGEASAALLAEMARRRIGSPEQLKNFSDQEARRKKRELRNPGSLFVGHLGIGRWYFGKASREYNLDTRIERFRTTIFITAIWFPLIPTGSYLVQKRRGFFSRKIVVLERLPLDWAQVLRVWSLAAAAVAALTALTWVLKRI